MVSICCQLSVQENSSLDIWANKRKREYSFRLEKINSTQVSRDVSILRPHLLSKSLLQVKEIKKESLLFLAQWSMNQQIRMMQQE